MDASAVYVCVDVETTGLAPNQNEIIEIGAAKVVDGVIVETFQRLIKPWRPLPRFITILTGIDSAMLSTAPRFEDVYEEFLDFLGDSVFVAHNALFDFDTINAELLRLRKPPITNPVLDTKEMAMILYPHVLSHKLSALAESLLIDAPHFHRALVDATCVAHFVIKMTDATAQLPPVLLKEISRLLSNRNPGLVTFFKQNSTPTLSHLPYDEYLYTRSATVFGERYDHEIDARSITSYFGDDSSLKLVFENYEKRPAQGKMADCVWDCFTHDRHGVIEAGTGTGKSLAYLIPAILYAFSSGKPVVISTKTKHLQDQLAKSDLPKLREILPSFSYVVLKGKENYIDLGRFDALYRHYLTTPTAKYALEFLGLFSWLLQTKTGDLAELHPSIHSRFFHKVNFISSESWKTKRYLNRCFVNRLRRDAKDVQLIITNHAMVFADLNSSAKILPSYDHIVFDEAHSIEDCVTSSFSTEFTTFTLHELFALVSSKKGTVYEHLRRLILEEVLDPEVQPFSKSLKSAVNDVERLLAVFFDAVESVFIQSPIQTSERQQRIIDMALRSQSIWIDCENAKSHLQKSLEVCAKTISDMITYLDNFFVQETEHLRASLQLALQLSLDSIDTLQFIFFFEPDYVNWIEQETSQKPILKLVSAPIHCAQLLSETLFTQAKSVILTSATLTVNDSFKHLLQRFGLPSGTCCLKLESDFVYSEQALLCLVKGLPAVEASEIYFKTTADLIAGIVKQLGGRSLVLLTSYRALVKISEHLKASLMHTGIQVHSQYRQASRESILEKFKSGSQKSVILGVDSFWEGVDVPGDSLSGVIIPKLPFPVPSDPLVMARSQFIEEQGGNGFWDYSVPIAVLKFKQGIGRLIRSSRDRGVLFILDERIEGKSYGRLFLNELTHYQKVTNSFPEILTDVKKWFLR